MTDLSRYGTPAYRYYVLFLLMLLYVLTTIDRGIITVLIEPIKNELGLSDTQAALLIGPAFAVFFVLAGIPLGRLADRTSRRGVAAACLFVWSVMTGLCGLASSFIQLAIGRIGVGVGEAGGPPAAVAMISDIFSAKRRASASAFFYAGAALGIMISFGIGGWIAAHYGWRAAFFAAALPGILLALVIQFTVREPPRGLSDGLSQDSEVVSLGQTLRFVVSQRSLMHLLSAATLGNLVGAGGMAFFVSYMLRSHAMDLPAAGLTVAFCYGIGSTIGVLSFGWLADHLAARDVRWRCRVPAITLAASVITFSTLVLAPSRLTMTIALALWSFSCSGYTASSYALFQSLVKVRMRATIGSIQFIVLAVVGGSVGPMVVGIGSDALAPTLGKDSLRFALLSLTVFYLWAVMHYIRAESTLVGDLRRSTD
jgi:MFS family permease